MTTLKIIIKHQIFLNREVSFRVEVFTKFLFFFWKTKKVLYYAEEAFISDFSGMGLVYMLDRFIWKWKGKGKATLLCSDLAYTIITGGGKDNDR